VDIQLTLHGEHDLAGQLYRQLRGAMVEGRLQEGERLPSTRDLARQLGVSRKTTLDVFERLIAEGFLVTRPGDGTFVSGGLTRLQASAPAQAVSQPVIAPIWTQLPDALAMPKPGATLPLDFRGGVTDKSQFPFEAWRRCMNHALRAQARGLGAYRDPAGEQELRLAVSRYLAFSRAVACNWEEVIVTQGAQQALDLIARVLIQPGDVVAVEEPGYPPARACLAALGAKVVPVPVDEHGLVVARLPAGAKLVYVTPSHQFPLGMPMSLERRAELLEWAQRHGTLIVEDDYDSEFRFEGRPLEPLKSLDRAGLVAYVGTFSKTIFPELRVGYVVPPPSLHPYLRKAKQIGDWHSCTLTQTALARFMLDGDFAKHLRRVHKLYTARRQVLIAHLQGGLRRWLEPTIPVAGLHLPALLAPPLTEQAVIAAAAAQSVALYGISGFYSGSPRQGLLFAYGGIDAGQIEVALGKVAEVLARSTRP
jgi:GntR family transcriptional regulator/MocR family aminotransferase